MSLKTPSDDLNNMVVSEQQEDQNNFWIIKQFVVNVQLEISKVINSIIPENSKVQEVFEFAGFMAETIVSALLLGNRRRLSACLFTLSLLGLSSLACSSTPKIVQQEVGEQKTNENHSLDLILKKFPDLGMVSCNHDLPPIYPPGTDLESKYSILNSIGPKEFESVFRFSSHGIVDCSSSSFNDNKVSKSKLVEEGQTDGEFGSTLKTLGANEWLNPKERPVTDLEMVYFPKYGIPKVLMKATTDRVLSFVMPGANRFKDLKVNRRLSDPNPLENFKFEMKLTCRGFKGESSITVVSNFDLNEDINYFFECIGGPGGQMNIITKIMTSPNTGDRYPFQTTYNLSNAIGRSSFENNVGIENGDIESDFAYAGFNCAEDRMGIGGTKLVFSGRIIEGFCLSDLGGGMIPGFSKGIFSSQGTFPKVWTPETVQEPREPQFFEVDRIYKTFLKPEVPIFNEDILTGIGKDVIDESNHHTFLFWEGPGKVPEKNSVASTKTIIAVTDGWLTINKIERARVNFQCGDLGVEPGVSAYFSAHGLGAYGIDANQVTCSAYSDGVKEVQFLSVRRKLKNESSKY